MIAIQYYTSFALVVEKRSEIDSTDHMPATFELLFKTFLYFLSCIFEISYFIFDHLNIDILSNQSAYSFISTFMSQNLMSVDI